MGLIPDEIERSLTLEDVRELAHYIMETINQADTGATGSQPKHRHFYDEILDITVPYRMRLEEGETKTAALERVKQVFRHAVTSPWKNSKHSTTERVKKFAEIAGALGSMNPSLLTGTTPGERLASFKRLIDHAEGIWRDAVSLYQSGSIARSCFLAITCLEEVGKAVASRYQVKAESICGPLAETPTQAGARRNNPFFLHRHKHFLAAASGAVFNQRMETIFGTDRLESILEMMQSGGLAELRERCLYVDVTDHVIWPEDEITADLARTWVVVAGEVMAEVLGYPEFEWERLIAVIQEFETTTGICSP